MSVNRAALPAPLYTAEQTRVLDRTAIERFSIPGIRLMQRAGHAVFAEIVERFPDISHLSILSGSGNNGGDGFVVAQLAKQKGFKVQLICVGESFEGRLQGEALQAWQQLTLDESEIEAYSAGMEIRGQLIVDAMLGTGLSGVVRGVYAQAIAQVNACQLPVFAVDTPSGLCADTGGVLGGAVKADLTLSFIGLKRGLFTATAVDYCGERLFDGLLLPEEVYDHVPVSVFRTTAGDLNEYLPRRPRSAHKGKFGHVLVIGGNKGMGGAALLAAEAAIRSGAGLVSLATRSEHVAAALVRCPEVMTHAVDSGTRLSDLLDKADIVVVGPGLGDNAWADQMLNAALTADKPLVLDADALNLLSEAGRFETLQRDDCICTPHPGEAARILGCDIESLQKDRFASVLELQQKCGGTVVLKGAGSLSTAGDVIHLCDAGNPGMAVGGMGDVLSGICGAFMAQGLTAENAARLAVYVHASAADRVVANKGEIGLLASELFSTLSEVINFKNER